jgi:hypothetical protein
MAAVRNAVERGGLWGKSSGSQRGRTILGALLVAWCCALGGAGAAFDESKANAIGTLPRRCELGKMWCSRCENTTALWTAGKGTDPAWITWKQIFAAPDMQDRDIKPTNGEPITRVGRSNFDGNAYHYFEFLVRGGDGLSAKDVRRDGVFFSLVSPDHIPVKRGQVIPRSEDQSKIPAWDFFIGQNCVPREGAWTNNGCAPRPRLRPGMIRVLGPSELPARDLLGLT